MSNVIVIPEGSTDIGEAAEGDLVLRSCGDQVEVARVRGDELEWLGGVPSDTIELPSVDGPTPSPDLVTAAKGVETALVNRGG
jgi:hypothetical protein